MKKYSIIVPMYNVEPYILECLTSIASSMLDSCECLIINDGSTDSSAKIASNFCISHTGFKLYHKENGGLSDARNYGLKFAKGQYIVFVDSDDVVNINFLSTLEKIIDEEPEADLIHFPFEKFYKDTSKLFNSPSTGKLFKVISKAKLAQESNFAWARVAKKELYQGNEFPVGIIYEDVATTPVLTFRAKKIVQVSMPMFGYRKRYNSITTSSAEKQFRLFDALDVLQQRYHEGLVDDKLFISAFVNLIQSCLVSLVRLSELEKRRLYRKMIIVKYKKLSNLSILGCYSKIKFKILSILSKYKLSICLIEFLLSPIVSILDWKNNLKDIKYVNRQ